MAAPGFLSETPDDPALAAARAEPLRAPPRYSQLMNTVCAISPMTSVAMAK